MNLRAIVLFLHILCSGTAFAIGSDSLEEARRLAKQGDYEIAISTAQKMLQKAMATETRFEVMKFIADIEYQRASLRGFKEAKAPLQALRVLRQEFPDMLDLSEWLWRVGWLEWKDGDSRHALQHLSELVQRYPVGPFTRDAHLLMTRIYLQEERFTLAEKHLLKFALLGSKTESHKVFQDLFRGLIGLQQGREGSFEEIKRAWAQGEHFIAADPFLFKRVIDAWNRFEPQQKTITLVEKFLSRYVDEPEVAAVNLLYGDLLRDLGYSKKAQLVYAVLAQRHPETEIGHKAFLRGLMVEYQNVEDEKRLAPIITAIRKVERNNQLSEIETEAQFDEGILFGRLAKHNPAFANNALMQWSLVADSGRAPYAERAVKLGKKLFSKTIASLHTQGKHEEVIRIWERFPVFREQGLSGFPDLMNVAKSFMSLGMYAPAESILQGIRKRSMGSIWDDHALLVLSRLWLQRGDTQAAGRLMAWLVSHGESIYQQELRLNVASIYLNQGDYGQAYEMLKQIHPQELGNPLPYWMLRGKVYGALKQWNQSAEAWARALQLAQDERQRQHIVMEQAKAWMQAGRYADAARLLDAIPENGRDAKWLYYSGVAQIKSGQISSGRERLQRIVNQNNSSHFALLARMELSMQSLAAIKEKMQ